MPDVWLRVEARLAERRGAGQPRAGALNPQPGQAPSNYPPPKPSVTTSPALAEGQHAPQQAAQLPEPTVAPTLNPAQHRLPPREEAEAFLDTCDPHMRQPPPRVDAVPPVPPAARPPDKRQPPPPPPLPASRRGVTFDDTGGPRHTLPYVPPCTSDSDDDAGPRGEPMVGASDEDSDPLPESAKLKRPPGWTSAPPAFLSKQDKAAWKRKNVRELLRFNPDYVQVNQAASQHAKSKRQKTRHAQHGHASAEESPSRSHQAPRAWACARQPSWAPGQEPHRADRAHDNNRDGFPRDRRPQAARAYAQPPNGWAHHQGQQWDNAQSPAEGYGRSQQVQRWANTQPPARGYARHGQQRHSQAYPPQPRAAQQESPNGRPSPWGGLSHYHRGGDQGTSHNHGTRGPSPPKAPAPITKGTYSLPPVIPPGCTSRNPTRQGRPAGLQPQPHATRWRHPLYNRTLGELVGPAAPLRPSTNARCNISPALPLPHTRPASLPTAAAQPRTQCAADA